LRHGVLLWLRVALTPKTHAGTKTYLIESFEVGVTIAVISRRLKIKYLIKNLGAGLYSNRKEGVNVILCDLCGKQKECFQREIDDREFDICTDCWRPLEEKLRGKGRSKRKREVVFLPPQITPEPEEPKTPPSLPPKIFGQKDLWPSRKGQLSAGRHTRLSPPAHHKHDLATIRSDDPSMG
jgi:hypothetical protein